MRKRQQPERVLRYTPGHPLFRGVYEAYLRSALWKGKRRQVLQRANGCCETCARETGHLEVHHVTYERLGAELLSDLLALCVSCHAAADAGRQMQTAFSARLAGWARKRYGDDWEAFYDPSDIHDEFTSFLERVEGDS